MASSQELFNKLFEEDHIRLERTAFFDRMPSRLPPSFNFDRIEGMLLGLAVGDSLGKTSESMTPSERRARFGEIKDYRPHPAVNNQPIGLPSDDTQLAYWMLECLLKDGGFDPDSVANAFSQERIYGVGSTMRGFLRNYKLGSKPWYECGPHSAGNGALMRIAPIVIPHLRKPSPALWSDTALCAMTTHNDPTSTSSCLAFVSMIWQLLGMKETPEPTWWLKTYIEVARELEGDPALEPRGGTHTDYVGSLCNYLDWVVPEAYEKDLSTREACDGCYSGAFLMETVPCVLYILMRHGDDFEEALIRAVNDTRDNDTVAAIVGAVLGALHGKQAIPERWLKGLSGRTRENDDGHAFELIEQSRRTFWEDEDGFDRVRSEDIGTSDHIVKVSRYGGPELYLRQDMEACYSPESYSPVVEYSPAMGLGAGGKMEQKIYPDEYGVDVWDTVNCAEVYVHIANSSMFERITGEKPPQSPISAETYTECGLPWFKLYDEYVPDLAAFDELAKVKTVDEMDVATGLDGETNTSIAVNKKQVVGINLS
jgi:ADP-ribosylglycohydrolase